MEHTAAISVWLTPILIGIIGALFLLEVGVMGKIFLNVLKRNEQDHNELFQSRNEHSRTLAQHEIRIDRVETEVEHIRSHD